MSPNLHHHASARSWTGRFAFIAICVLIACAAAACRPHTPEGKAPPMPERPIADVLASHTPELMAMPGVVGTYQGAGPDGTPTIVVMLASPDAGLERRIPRVLEDWPVVVEITGEIRAMPDSAR
jgi:uncharacterized protein (DUF362 family)